MKFFTRNLLLSLAVWQFSSLIDMLCKFSDPAHTFVDLENERPFFPLPCMLKHPNALHCSIRKIAACPLEVYLRHSKDPVFSHRELGFRLLRKRTHHLVGGNVAVTSVK